MKIYNEKTGGLILYAGIITKKLYNQIHKKLIDLGGLRTDVINHVEGSRNVLPGGVRDQRETSITVYITVDEIPQKDFVLVTFNFGVPGIISVVTNLFKGDGNNIHFDEDTLKLFA